MCKRNLNIYKENYIEHNKSADELVVEDSFKLDDECLHDGWEDEVNPAKEQNYAVSMSRIYTNVELN